MKVYKAAVFILISSLLFGAESDSLNCRFIGNWPFGPSSAVAYDAQRNLVFCGSGGGVYILDVSNPSQPRKISEAIHSRGIVRGLFYLNNRLYIACGPAGLEIWCLTNPSSPSKLGSYRTPGYAYGVYVSSSYAYVADGNSGLRIINISNPYNPFEVGLYDTPGLAYGVYVSGSYAYVADAWAGLRIIDISNPSNPFETGFYDTPDYACGVYVSNSYAYVADGWAGLQIYEFLTVGIEEDREPLAACRLSFEIYPNPAKSYLAVRLPQTACREKIRIFDVSGKLVQEITSKPEEKIIRISLKGMKPGVYILQSGKRKEKFAVIK